MNEQGKGAVDLLIRSTLLLHPFPFIDEASQLLLEPIEQLTVSPYPGAVDGNSGIEFLCDRATDIAATENE